MTVSPNNIGRVLDARRRALGISVRILAQRSGLGQATVQRVLAGTVRERMGTVCAIASQLGMVVELRPIRDVNSLRRQTARQKARGIVSRVQGNFALEGQGVPERARRRVETLVARRLLSGPKIRLWS